MTSFNGRPMAARRAAAFGLAAALAASAASAAPALPKQADIDADLVMTEANRLFGRQEYKPFDIAIFAMTGSMDEKCTLIRLLAKDYDGALTDPAETELIALPPEVLPEADAYLCAPPADDLGKDEGVSPVTPPTKLTKPKRLKRLYRKMAKAVFGAPGDAAYIRRVQISFGYSKAEAFDLSKEMIVTLSLFQADGGAPEFEFLNRIDMSGLIAPDDRAPAGGVRYAQAAGQASDAWAPYLLYATVGPNETGWLSYAVLTPNISGGSRKVRVTYQYFVSGSRYTTTYTGRCREATVQSALAHYKTHDGTNFCRCEVANGDQCK